MEDLTVYSIELEANSHPYDYHYTLSGNTVSKKSVVITPSDTLIKLKNRPGFHKKKIIEGGNQTWVEKLSKHTKGVKSIQKKRNQQINSIGR